MPAVRDIVSSALNKLTHAAHAELPAPGALLRGQAARASRAVPAARVRRVRVRVRSPELEAAGPYGHGGVEPSLEEVLRDPIVRALMRRDGVRPEDIRRRP